MLQSELVLELLAYTHITYRFLVQIQQQNTALSSLRERLKRKTSIKFNANDGVRRLMLPVVAATPP
jgi:hypothetical protein